jgi:hypothetical protein
MEALDRSLVTAERPIVVRYTVYSMDGDLPRLRS